MAKDPTTILNRYKTGIQGAGPAYREGVENPRRSWSRAYVESIPRMVEGLQRSIAENKPQAAVQALGDQGFKDKTLSKADRFTQAAPRATEGYAAIVNKVAQAATAGQNAALAIPANTWEDRLRRVRANAEAIAGSWGKKLV